MSIVECVLFVSGSFKSTAFPGSEMLPNWAKACVAYMLAVIRDCSIDAQIPPRVLRRRFRSLQPLTFRRSIVEKEFTDLNKSYVPLQMVTGVFLLSVFFTIHFVTLYNTMPDLTRVVVGEFVFSVILALALVAVCFSYCFRNILELTLSFLIGLVRHWQWY